MSLVDNKLKVWYTGTNSSSVSSILSTSRQYDQTVVTDLGDDLLRIKRRLRVPQYMIGMKDVVTGHDLVKWNGVYYLFYTKFTGSGYNIRLVTSTDLKNWSDFKEITDYTKTDTTYNYGNINPSVVKSDKEFKMYFQAYDSKYAGSIIYVSTSVDGSIWNTPTKALGIVAGTACSKWLGCPSVIRESETSYKMYFIGYNGTTYVVMMSTSTDGITWGTPLSIVKMSIK